MTPGASFALFATVGPGASHQESGTGGSHSVPRLPTSRRNASHLNHSSTQRQRHAVLMTFFIGTDEAGYGPNLGPLLITATAWSFPEGTDPEQCWELLADAVSNKSPERPDQLQVGDSKQLYSPGKSISPLEQAVLSVLRLQDVSPTTFGELGQAVAGNSFAADLSQEKCLNDQPLHLPLETPGEVIEQSALRLQHSLQTAGAALVSIRSRVIFPPEFNRLVEQAGSKGRVLSTETLQLVADIIRDHEPSAAQIICDKHGGRNRYDELLSAAFDDRLVFRLEEGRHLSRYRLDQLEFRFQTKAEAHLPVALASMVSKYIREIAMHEFNGWWQQKIPDLKPTQGYPVDAARFWEDIAEEADRQQIARELIWRQR